LSIVIDYSFKARIGEETLLARLNRLRRKLESLDLKHVGPVMKIDPLQNPTVTNVAKLQALPVPPAVAERLEAADKDDLNTYRILLNAYLFAGFPHKILLEFTEPSRNMALHSDLWNPADYPEEFEVPFFLRFNREALLFEFANSLLMYGYVLAVTPMNGCEPVTIGLATNRNLSRPLFLGGGFTKTQYADDFPRAHELVCQILDLAKEERLLYKASDTCEYYETRDWSTSMKIANRELDFTWMVSNLLDAGVNELKKQGVSIETVVDNASTISPPSARPGPRDWHEAFEDEGAEARASQAEDGSEEEEEDTDTEA